MEVGLKIASEGLPNEDLKDYLMSLGMGLEEKEDPGTKQKWIPGDSRKASF